MRRPLANRSVGLKWLAVVALLAIATLVVLFQLELPRTRSSEAASHAAAVMLSDTYARLLQHQYDDLTKEPTPGELRQLICEQDAPNIERQRRFRALHPPSREAVAHYQQVVVSARDVVVSTDVGEFILVERHPAHPPQYQRYTIAKGHDGWRICSPD